MASFGHDQDTRTFDYAMTGTFFAGSVAVLATGLAVHLSEPEPGTGQVEVTAGALPGGGTVVVGGRF